MVKLIVSAQVRLAEAGRALAARTSNRKAAGMLEYALVALLSIAVFAGLNLVFPKAVEGIFTKVTSTINPGK